MSTGSLLFPLGYMPLDDDGSPVPSGKLTFSRTGTSTAQDTYSDSTLSTANANPVVLDSAGRVSGKIYGDPASGYDYRVKFSTSADVQIWQHDDVKVDGAATAVLAEGSFTATLTGYATPPTGTITYRIMADASGDGAVCILARRSSTAISGTSNADTLTLTGLPSACVPGEAVLAPAIVTDDGSLNAGCALISASGTTIQLTMGSPLSATGFTNTGTKGLSAGWTLIYQL